MKILQGYTTHIMKHGTQEIEQEICKQNIDHPIYSIKQLVF